MKIFKKRTLFTIFLIIIAGSAPLLSGPIDLNKEKIYVRKGFDIKWIKENPELNTGKWHVINPLKNGKRKILLKELPFKDIPERTFFSLKKYPPENFTFISVFTLNTEDIIYNNIQGIFFANIGENWAVYINGHLLKSEIHLDENGEITRYRHMREVLIPIDPRTLKKGKNIIAIRIIGDPNNIDSAFHRSVPFIIEDYTLLQDKRTETVSLILIFLYLFFGIYHVFIYMIRTSEKYNLYYGAFSLFLFIYLFSRTHSVYSIITDSTVLHRIEYCSLFALIPLAGAFMDLLIKRSYSLITRIYAIFYSLLIVIVVLPVSNAFAIDVLRVWQVSVIVPVLYYTFISIGLTVYRNSRIVYKGLDHMKKPARILRTISSSLAATTAGNLLIGTLIIAACTVFDILDSMFWSYELVISQYGFFIFMIGITLILANRFIIIHKKLENFSEETRIEMRLATDMQVSLLPPAPENLKDWDIALSYIPKHGASGDCYDFYMYGSSIRGISLFDVTGHGLSAALITMIIKPEAARIFNKMGGVNLDEIIGELNARISRDLEVSHSLVSSVMLRIEGNDIEYVNAGHPDILLRDADTGTVSIAGPSDMPFRGELLGANITRIRPVVQNFTMKKNDTLMLFTDGIMDSINSHKTLYGMERLTRALQNAPGESAGAVLDFILDDFSNFIKKKESRDDITIIILRKK